MGDAHRKKLPPWVSDVHEPGKMQLDQNPCLCPIAETSDGGDIRKYLRIHLYWAIIRKTIHKRIR